METQPQKPRSTPKDVFLQLLHIGTLYASAVSLIALLFQFVNRLIPDALAWSGGIPQAIRWSLSALVILFPVFLWVSRMLERDIIANPAKRELAIRRWLLHLTLFVSAITIIVDLITLVYNYLGGEVSPRFYLKVLAVLAVAAVVFAYYIWDLRRESSDMPKKMKTLARAAIAAIMVTIVGGFIVAGSPASERLRQFDERRVGDLQSLQYQIIDFWQRKSELPESLSDLKNDLSGFIPPLDPESQQPYVYRKKDKLVFELCAIFSLESRNESNGYPKAVPVGPYGSRGEYGPAAWDHGKGEQCFERTVDPEIYKPYPKEQFPPPRG